MGTRTASSTRPRRSPGRPHASFPNTQAVGGASRPPSMSSSDRSADPSAASTVRPASWSEPTSVSNRGPTTSGMWKRLPAEARTHLPLYGSTHASVKITNSDPAASAVRSTVPALPGSRTWASTVTSGGAGASALVRETSTNAQTASSPCGVTVCARSAMISPVTRSTGTPDASARSTSSGCLASASVVVNSSTSTPGRSSASRTACGPSVRKRRSRRRKARLASRLAAFTRGERMEVSSRPAISVSIYAGTTPLSGGLVLCPVRGEGLLGQGDQCGERLGVVDRKLGQYAPVDLDLGGLQALNESVVGHPVGPGRRVDPLDPQPPELALAVLAVPVGIGHRVEHLLLGLAVQARPLATVATRPLEDDPALLGGVDRPLHACHVSNSFVGAGAHSLVGSWALRPVVQAGLLAEQLLDVLAVALGNHDQAVQATGTLRR